MKIDRLSEIKVAIGFAWAISWRCATLEVTYLIVLKFMRPDLLVDSLLRLPSMVITLWVALIWVLANRKNHIKYMTNRLSTNKYSMRIQFTVKVMLIGIFIRWYLIDKIFELILGVTVDKPSPAILYARDSFTFFALAIAAFVCFYESEAVLDER